MAPTTPEVLTSALKGAHWLINVTFDGVEDELANRPAPGTANPLGTAYAHVVLAEDAIINGMFQGKPPLSATARTGSTGVDQPMPMSPMVEGDLGEWYRTAKVDVAALKDYAAEVFAASEEYVAGLDEEGLGRMIEIPFGDMGQMPLSQAISMLVVQHCDNYAGEISAIKGVFGLKGYPF